MIKVTYIESNGTSHIVEGNVGQSLMQIAVDNLVPGILGDCGGCCTCATCHAYVDPAWIDRIAVPGVDELLVLEGVIDVAPNSRLCCQLKCQEFLNGIILRVPESQG